MARAFAVKKVAKNNISLMEGVIMLALLLAIVWSILMLDFSSVASSFMIVPILVFVSAVLLFYAWNNRR
jgi:tryptophan-rich sensory protein